MKYLCFVYSEEKKIETMSHDECMEYDNALRTNDLCLPQKLQPVQTLPPFVFEITKYPLPMALCRDERTACGILLN
jgi:hypothetical protein